MTSTSSATSEYLEVGGATSYLARPTGAVTAGLVLIPTVSGINRFAREYADHLARLGYATLAWNQYPGTQDGLGGDEARAYAAKLTTRGCLDHLRACVDYVERDLSCSTVGMIGFCFGGRFTLLAAASDPRIAAAAAVYPSMHEAEEVTRAAEIRAPVQLVYPGQDHIVSRETFRALEANLYARSAPTTILYYPDAGHGFMHHPSPANDAATRAARPQIDAFLAASLTR
jgi:carboxymethylenebutenolidase